MSVISRQKSFVDYSQVHLKLTTSVLHLPWIGYINVTL